MKDVQLNFTKGELWDNCTSSPHTRITEIQCELKTWLDFVSKIDRSIEKKQMKDGRTGRFILVESTHVQYHKFYTVLV